jgi:hypothetical protein
MLYCAHVPYIENLLKMQPSQDDISYIASQILNIPCKTTKHYIHLLNSSEFKYFTLLPQVNLGQKYTYHWKISHDFSNLYATITAANSQNNTH